MSGQRSRLPHLGKVLAVLALLLPMGAFVVGSLVASAADEPARRDPIVIAEAPSPGPDRTPSPPSTPAPTPSEDDDGDGEGDDDDRDDGDDDEIEVVTPEPGEVDDEHGRPG